MKEEIKKKLEENAIELLDFVKKSTEFVVDQAPIYIQELLSYHFFENILSLILYLFIRSISSVISIISLRWGSRNKWKQEEHIVVPAIATIVFIAALIIGGVGAVERVKECYKAKYAPRVLIIEKLKSN